MTGRMIAKFYPDAHTHLALKTIAIFARRSRQRFSW